MKHFLILTTLLIYTHNAGAETPSYQQCTKALIDKTQENGHCWIRFAFGKPYFLQQIKLCPIVGEPDLNHAYHLRQCYLEYWNHETKKWICMHGLQNIKKHTLTCYTYTEKTIVTSSLRIIHSQVDNTFSLSYFAPFGLMLF